MNAISHTEPPPENRHAESPGRLLQRGRVAKGLSVQDVAGQLRLHPQVITAMEADRFDTLAGPVFVQGYAKSYSRLVDIDPDPILAAVRSRMGGLKPRSATRFLGNNRHHRFQDRQRIGASLMRWGLLIVGFILLVYWWGQSATVQKLLSHDTLTPPKVEEPAHPSLPIGRSSSVPVHVHTAPEEPVASPPIPEPSVPHEAPVASAPEPSPAKAPDTPPVAASPQVVLEFDKHAWVSVKDSKQESLVKGDFSKGSRKVLQGTPPFQFVIKYPSAVRVIVNGKPYDFSSFVNRKGARFTLDPGKIP
ncbi:cytoskeleton protein RodZ [Gammaproteobacteria bacterium]